MSVDRTLLGNYISSKLPSPRGLIFISDRAEIFPQDGSLRIVERDYPIVFFDTGLEVRDKLEIYKDNLGQRRFIIVSQKSAEEEVSLLDYIARSSYLIITPKDVLEFAQDGHKWTDVVNQLRCEDFWDSFEALKMFRQKLDRNISPVECAHVVLSALLDIDLAGKISYRDAIEVWKQCKDVLDSHSAGMRSSKSVECKLDKYPALLNTLDRKLRSLFPLLEKLKDAGFVRFLWTSSCLDLSSQRILSAIWQRYGNIPVAQIKRLRDQLAKNYPELVIEHVKQTEKWLSSDVRRMSLFNAHVGVDGTDLVKTAQFAASERIFCSPMRDALRNLAERISLSPDILPEQLINSVLSNIEKHLFLQDDANYLRIKDTFNAFACFIKLSRLLEKSKHFPKDSIFDIYPEYLSRLEYLRDRFELLNFKCELLKDALMKAVFRKVGKLVRDYNAAFAQLVKTDYARWVSGKGKSPLLAKDFLHSLFFPRYEEYVQGKEQTAYIILFDGMRWDCWNLIEPKLLKIFDGKLKLEKTVLLLSTLPTMTEYAKPALFVCSQTRNVSRLPIGLSDIGTGNWYELEIFKKRHISAKTITDFGQNLGHIAQLIEDEEVSVKVLNLPLIDPKLHNSQRNLSTLYEEVMVNFDDIVEPCLERIPPNSLVFVLSDHGFIEIKGEPKHIPNGEINVKRRYIELRSFTQLPSLPEEIVFFDSDDIHMPTNIARYGFATSNAHFVRRDLEAFKPSRYAHGGISMQEMIVPCAIFVPENGHP